MNVGFRSRCLGAGHWGWRLFHPDRSKPAKPAEGVKIVLKFLCFEWIAGAQRKLRRNRLRGDVPEARELEGIEDAGILFTIGLEQSFGRRHFGLSQNRECSRQHAQQPSGYDEPTHRIAPCTEEDVLTDVARLGFGCLCEKQPAAECACGGLLLPLAVERARALWMKEHGNC